MNIAIIGGGFYGCHLAKKISNLGHKVDLYEKNKDILQEAILNNQHRLHLGFHYPRCDSTIKQAKRSYYKFISEYGSCVEDIENNYYLIHKNSNVDFLSYKNIYKKHEISFEEISKSSLSDYFVNIDDIDGVIKVDEKKINLFKLTSFLKQEIYKSKNINLFLNAKVENISDDSEVLINDNYKKYDYVINATYFNPSLGLKQDSIQVKNELCFLSLVSIDDSKFFNKAFTIMDGQYISLYPADYKNTFTISSVIYTPYLKGFNLEHNMNDKKSLFENCTNANNKINEHFLEFINIDTKNIKFIKSYISYKTKILNDTNDVRTSFYLKNNKNISLLCGKISAILDLEKDILNEII